MVDLYKFVKNMNLFEWSIIIYNIILLIQVWLGKIDYRTLGLLLLFEIFFAGICEITIAFRSTTISKGKNFVTLISFLFTMGVLFAIVGYTIISFISENLLYLFILFLPFAIRLFTVKPNNDKLITVSMTLFLFFVIFAIGSYIFYLLSFNGIISSKLEPSIIVPRFILTIALISKIIVELAIYSRD